MQQEDLKGNVKFCRQIKEGNLSSEIWYDTLGRVIKKKVFSYYDNYLSMFIKKSYKNKTCITHLEMYNKERKLLEKHKIITDEFDNVIYRIIKDVNDKIVAEVNRSFDEKGKLKELKTLVCLINYDYDKYGNLLKSIKYDKENNLIETEINTYNVKNKKASWKHYDSNGLLVGYKYYKYSNDKIVQKIRFYKPGNNTDLSARNYIEILKDFKGISNQIDAFKTDINSKEVENHLSIDFFDSATFYKYDTNENLVRKSTYVYQPYFKEGTLNDKYVNGYKYDENNQLIYKSEFEQMTERDLFEEYHYSPNDLQTEKEDKAFDKKGNITYCKNSYSETSYEYKYYGYKSLHLTPCIVNCLLLAYLRKFLRNFHGFINVY
ncbi:MULTISPECIES: hypothetical protein [Winogradskyella]|uniref:hypothetical protein n=1 Tax=Winogradskyella TaxID=286104 RepID=UPI0015C8A83E|nr:MULTISPECIES: hypothetical protein [Winogradskyella]QXP78730.1 hypothetical protein H0I32_16230 [Winogradskyella sp. HaHa_3_26]